MNYLKFLIILILCLAFVRVSASAQEPSTPWWPVQSVDTMKYSRDVAREKLTDPSFDAVIDAQVAEIARIGATHVAIGTPYEAEFVPFLKRWVEAARKYNLKVWYRGNVAGWEKWFGYERITRDQHQEQIKAFLLANPDLFEDGDIFTSCPECENGGPGDPRMNGDAAGHKAFLISEYRMVKNIFKEMGKEVTANYYSMNGDVVNLIMDPETTRALDGVVAVDHYVGSVDKLVADVKRYAQKSGGKVVLAEFGAPIPDLHGEMTQEQQAQWIASALEKLSTVEELIGINYWVNVGGSTQLWDGKGTPRLGVADLQSAFTPQFIVGKVMQTDTKPLAGLQIVSAGRTVVTDLNGFFKLPYLYESPQFLEIKDGDKRLTTYKVENPKQTQSVVIPKIEAIEEKSWLQKVLAKLLSWLGLE